MQIDISYIDSASIFMLHHWHYMISLPEIKYKITCTQHDDPFIAIFIRLQKIYKLQKISSVIVKCTTVICNQRDQLHYRRNLYYFLGNKNRNVSSQLIAFFSQNV